MTKSSAAKILLVPLGVILILGGSCAGLLGVSGLSGSIQNVLVIAGAVAAIAMGVLAIVWSRK
jgi:uncharacterized membrane protein YjjB (DUF3815 family)